MEEDKYLLLAQQIVQVRQYGSDLLFTALLHFGFPFIHSFIHCDFSFLNSYYFVLFCFILFYFVVSFESLCHILDIIDPAMMRPGRLDKPLYIPLPTSLDRVQILRTVCATVPVDASVNLESIATDHRANGFRFASIRPLFVCSIVDISLVKSKKKNLPYNIDWCSKVDSLTIIHGLHVWID
jgi:hypothetical protein